MRIRGDKNINPICSMILLHLKKRVLSMQGEVNNRSCRTASFLGQRYNAEDVFQQVDSVGSGWRFCYPLSFCVSGNIGSGDFWEYILQRRTTEFLPLERQSGLIHQRSCLMCSMCTYFSENRFVGQDSFSSK